MDASQTERAHINEMQDDLRRKLAESTRRDSGRGDTLRATILGLVVGENYDSAKVELMHYVESKNQFPSFQERVERLVQHCTELIEAVGTKRRFPGLMQLSLSKQQEIHEKVLEHFEDLKRTLRQVEKIDREHKLRDVRATVYVVHAAVGAVLMILAGAIYADSRHGLLGPLISVTSDYLDIATNWVVGKIPL